MGAGLENVRNIYLEGIAQGHARDAVTRYTGHRYTQHSTGVADGVEGFLDFFEPFLARNPKRDISIVRIIEEGPWVFCSAFQSLNDGEAKWVTMDMFYTDDAGLILEHWDTIAPYAEATRSGNEMVGGTTEVNPQADSNNSRAVVLEFTKQVMQEDAGHKLDHFVAEDLIQHGADIDAGRAGLAAWLKSPESGRYEMLFHTIAQGDFVMTYGKRFALEREIAVFDLYRVSGGLIVEHWSNPETILPRAQWGNSGKF
ncbi:MAG: hypothetical protein AAF353_21015 [Pseudomonadota bacterium]